jgi:hypothetical protein
MCATINSQPVQTQEPLACLQCRKLLALIPSMVFEVSDDAGVFLGYLHKDCLDEWRKTNSGTVVTPLTKA